MELALKHIPSDHREKARYLALALVGIFLSFLLCRFSVSSIFGLLVSLSFLCFFFLNIKMAIMFFLLFSTILFPLQGYTTLFPGTSHSINANGMLNIFLVLFSLGCLVFNRGSYKGSVLYKPVLIFLSISFLGVLVSSDKWISIRAWFGYAMPLAFYLIILNFFRDVKNLERLRDALILSAIIPISVGLYQIVFGAPVTVFLPNPNEYNRIYGTFAHFTPFASYLVILMPQVMFLYSQSRKPIMRLLYPLLFMVMLVCLFCTYTRVAWAAFLVTMGMVGLAKYRKFFIAMVVVLLLVVSFAPAVSQIFLQRIQPDSSFYGRFSLNELSLLLFSQKPVLGHGLETYKILSASFFEQQGAKYGREIGYGAHNDYLRTLAENGILGFLAFMFLFYSIMKMGYKIYKSGRPELKSEALILLATVFGVMVICISDSGFAQAGIYMWTLIGIVERKYRLENTKTFDQTEQII